MKSREKLVGTLMAALVLTIPVAMCAERMPIEQHPLAGLLDSALITHGTHPLAVASNHWDSSDLTLGKKSCGRQFAEKALKRDFWGMVRVGLFCPSTAYSY